MLRGWPEVRAAGRAADTRSSGASLTDGSGAALSRGDQEGVRGATETRTWAPRLPSTDARRWPHAEPLTRQGAFQGPVLTTHTQAECPPEGTLKDQQEAEASDPKRKA